jgi:hypothetical protein
VEGKLKDVFRRHQSQPLDRVITVSCLQPARGHRRGGVLRAMDYFNGDPVVHTWTYNLDKAA